MKKIIAIIHFNGLTLNDFRRRNKSERALLWTMAVMSYEIVISENNYNSMEIE